MLDGSGHGLIALGLWLLLAWPVDSHTGQVDASAVVVGLVVALGVSASSGSAAAPRLARWLDPRRYLWAVVYLGVFLWHVVLANLDVAYRVLHPRLPIQPGIVKVRTALRSPAARTLLANSITLTPGTLTVELSREGWLYVHWLNVRATDPEQAHARIGARFERILGRIFE
ncbi:MAG: Na+/H+ antiporter subunit E [Myxococcota bacterium]|nr:Na+/H+ antiporter subunit E [Myxococcota bacterium]